MQEIKIPSLGESITEATLLKWKKNQGEFVKQDEILLEIETEKVTIEVTAPCDGLLETILAKEGDTVSIGQIVGKITNKSNSQESQSVNSTAQPKNQEIGQEISPGIIQEIKVSPAARKIANDRDINLTEFKGSGKDGMIMKSDLLDAADDKKQLVDAPSLPFSDEVTRVKMSRLRKTIAERLKESQNTAAILTTFNEVDMSNIMTMRQKYKDEFEKQHNIKLGFMSFFVKAAVSSLEIHPIINAQIDGDYVVYNKSCHIGVAVGSQQGLVVPVVRNAQSLSFAEIEITIGDLSAKARENKLEMADLMGGTFTISNGGIYGSLLSTPIINPPQSAILGMHKIQDRAVVINGEIKIRPMMYLALSYDHRIIDGKDAVTFLSKLKEFLESPDKLLLEL